MGKAVPLNPVREEDRQYFAERVEYWRLYLGMLDWRVKVSPIWASKGCMAEVKSCDYSGRCATIRLGRDFGSEPVNQVTLDETALHEVLHIFLDELSSTMQLEGATHEQRMSCEHRIINVLEKILPKAAKYAA
jgi:hypothetical protein